MKRKGVSKRLSSASRIFFSSCTWMVEARERSRPSSSATPEQSLPSFWLYLRRPTKKVVFLSVLSAAGSGWRKEQRPASRARERGGRLKGLIIEGSTAFSTAIPRQGGRAGASAPSRSSPAGGGWR